MSAAARRFATVGEEVDVTNHYIDRTDHPCYGTTRRTVTAVSSAGISFDGDHVPWPRAAHVHVDAGTMVLAERVYSGGVRMDSGVPFLTVRKVPT